MGNVRKMTPEAARALRSRAMRFLVISLGAVLATKGAQEALAAWLDVHLANVPTWLAGVVPAGGAIVSALVSFVGSQRGDPTDTYLTGDVPSPALSTPVGTWVAVPATPSPPQPPELDPERVVDVRGDGSELYVAPTDPPAGAPPVPAEPVEIPADEGDGGKGHLLPPGGF